MTFLSAVILQVNRLDVKAALVLEVVTIDLRRRARRKHRHKDRRMLFVAIALRHMDLEDRGVRRLIVDKLVAVRVLCDLETKGNRMILCAKKSLITPTRESATCVDDFFRPHNRMTSFPNNDAGERADSSTDVVPATTAGHGNSNCMLARSSTASISASSSDASTTSAIRDVLVGYCASDLASVHAKISPRWSSNTPTHATRSAAREWRTHSVRKSHIA